VATCVKGCVVMGGTHFLAAAMLDNTQVATLPLPYFLLHDILGTIPCQVNASEMKATLHTYHKAARHTVCNDRRQGSCCNPHNANAA
jgi:hypothetical protein